MTMRTKLGVVFGGIALVIAVMALADVITSSNGAPEYIDEPAPTSKYEYLPPVETTYDLGEAVRATYFPDPDRYAVITVFGKPVAFNVTKMIMAFGMLLCGIYVGLFAGYRMWRHGITDDER